MAGAVRPGPPKALPEYVYVSKLLALPLAELLTIIAKVLDERVRANDALLHGQGQERKHMTRFHAKEPPAIAIEAYLSRLWKFTPYPLDAILLSVVYINRITQLGPADFKHAFQPLFPSCKPKPGADPGRPYQSTSKDPPPPLTSYTVHRIVLTVLLIAASYISDSFIPLARAAKVGGVSKKELHQLEIECFVKLSFDCVVPPDELESIAKVLWASSEHGTDDNHQKVESKDDVESVGNTSAEDKSGNGTTVQQEEQSPPVHVVSPPRPAPSPPKQHLNPWSKIMTTNNTDTESASTPSLSEGGSESSYFSTATEADGDGNGSSNGSGSGNGNGNVALACSPARTCKDEGHHPNSNPVTPKLAQLDLSAST